MARFPCSTCSGRIAGKAVTVYAAWYDAARQRVSYRLRLCLDCVVAQANTVWGHRDDPNGEHGSCPACGGYDLDDQVLVYFVVYPPKQEPRYYDVPYCVGCWQLSVKDLALNGERMPNRDGYEAGAPALQDADWDTVLP